MLLRLICIAGLLVGVAATAHSEPRAIASAAPTERWCDITTIDHATAANSGDGDAWGQDAMAKLQAAGCRAGDVISFRNFNWQSSAAARFCDFTQAIYSDSEAIVCRWTGRLRVANSMVVEP